MHRILKLAIRELVRCCHLECCDATRAHVSSIVSCKPSVGSVAS